MPVQPPEIAVSRIHFLRWTQGGLQVVLIAQDRFVVPSAPGENHQSESREVSCGRCEPEFVGLWWADLRLPSFDPARIVHAQRLRQPGSGQLIGSHLCRGCNDGNAQAVSVAVVSPFRPWRIGILKSICQTATHRDQVPNGDATLLLRRRVGPAYSQMLMHGIGNFEQLLLLSNSDQQTGDAFLHRSDVFDDPALRILAVDHSAIS